MQTSTSMKQITKDYMRHFELVNSKTKSITLMPADAIKNMELKELASELDLYQSITRGIVTLTRIG
jgi:hypothetical protein